MMIKNKVDEATISDKIQQEVNTAVSGALGNLLGVGTLDARIEGIIAETTKKVAEGKGANLELYVKEAEKRLAEDDLFKGDNAKTRIGVQILKGASENMAKGLKGMIETLTKYYPKK